MHQSFPCHPPDLAKLKDQLMQFRQIMLERANEFSELDTIHKKHQKSAQNLLHYLALRTNDIRELQIGLTEWGLSSLGRAERKVQATIDTVLHVMHRLMDLTWEPMEQPPVCFREGRQLLENNASALFGEPTSGRRVRIMVTMPTEAAENYGLVHELLESGMNCARINSAHDGPDTWSAIIDNIRQAETATGKHCRILMDLGGPKLRTGPLEPGTAVLKVRPQRNERGIVQRPSRIVLSSNAASVFPEADAVIPVPASFLQNLKPGKSIRLTDARNSNRRLHIVGDVEGAVRTECHKTVYFEPGTLLKYGKDDDALSCKVGELPHRENFILLKPDDRLLLTRSIVPGRPANLNSTQQPAKIGCTVPEVLDDVRIGEPIWFDDGKIGGEIEKIESDHVQVRVTHARPQGTKLRSEKGINFPHTNLRLRALTDEDKNHLRFVVKHADMVGLSFANRPEDVQELIDEIEQLTDTPPPIIMKIETPRGFDNLPAMLLTALQSEQCGVMIARGDLAIESGFGRLAEIQEQILWLCEAAHVPVIWATQVLEGLAKQGLPTRAEVTDAAMGERAECIMLNKGEHIGEATRALSGILSRMQDHQTKKRSLLRKLNVAEKFFKSLKQDT